MHDVGHRATEDERRLAAFEQKMALPILASAVLPIVLTMSGTDSVVAAVVLVATWFVFVADFVVHARLLPGYLRSGRGRFDLLVVVVTAPWFLLPGLGASRFAALARLARLARVAKAGGGRFLNLARQLGRVGVVTGLTIVTCAYVAYGAERSVNDAYGDFGEALWWATVTMTTVGYGDIFPVTTTGRIAGVVLMFSGLAVLGVLAGTLATFFGLGDDATAEPADGDVEPSTANGSSDADLRTRLDELERAIAAVRRELG